MADTQKTLFDSLKQAVKDGATRAASEIGQELSDKGKQGAHELAAALFHGNAFVMYGQNRGAKEPPQQEQARGGMER